MKTISNSEARLLGILWQLEHASVQQIREAYAKKYRPPLAYNTIMTMLVRMVSKKTVSVSKNTEPFIYRPLAKKPVVVRSKLNEFIRSMFGGNAEELVSHLIETEELSKSDLTRIEALICARKNAP